MRIVPLSRLQGGSTVEKDELIEAVVELQKQVADLTDRVKALEAKIQKPSDLPRQGNKNRLGQFRFGGNSSR